MPLECIRPAMNRAALTATLLLALAGTAQAGPIAAGAGADYFSGPGGETNKAAVAFGSASLLGADLTIAGARYDDNQIGRGVTGIGSVGVPLGVSTKIRVTGARSIGDDTYRGWRVKTGPEFTLPGGPTLGLYYTHTSDNLPTTSNLASGEIDVPLHSAISAQGSLAFGSLPDGQNTRQAGLGLRVSPSRHFLFSGEVDVGHNVVGGLASGIPGSGSGRVQKLGNSNHMSGGMAGTTSSSDLTASLQLGFRFVFP